MSKLYLSILGIASAAFGLWGGVRVYRQAQFIVLEELNLKLSSGLLWLPGLSSLSIGLFLTLVTLRIALGEYRKP